MTAVLLVAAAVASVLSGLRWLRLAQREHYQPGRVSLFAGRWWAIPANVAVLTAGVAAAAVSIEWPAALLVTAAAVSVGPLGLDVRGRTRPLRWTPRLIRLALATGALLGASVAIPAAAAGKAVEAAAVALVLLPVFVDLALALMSAVERRLSAKWITQARERLAAVRPVCVAITGSYGKTTTKVFSSQLLSGRYRVVASPASFNNELGLARTINEHLALGTEVFIAEMGAYGPGEIRKLVSWINPAVAVITGIGPVHLERFGSIDSIVEAKAEIAVGAETVVLNVDSPELMDLAGRLRNPRVIRCSSLDPTAEVFVGATDGSITVQGKEIGVFLSEFPGNLACAVAVAWALDATPDRRALSRSKAPEHRRQLVTGARGFRIVDDTYNANPTGALAALRMLEAANGRRVVVTPGLVELGSMQYDANREFGRAAGSVASDVVIVGRTNRKALLEGVAGRGAAVRLVGSREEAVEWSRANLGPGDIVLYENDLPDHFP